MRGALSFLTVLGRGSPPRHFDYAWFPFIGAGVGVLCALGLFLIAEISRPPLAAATALILSVGLTGALHLDGLGDAADGLLAATTPDRRLTIMQDVHLGSFGVTALVLVLLLQFNAYTELATSLNTETAPHDPADKPAVFALVAYAFALSRWVMTAGSLLPYQRPGGMGTAFSGGFAPIAIGLSFTLGIAGIAIVAQDPEDSFRAGKILSVTASGLLAGGSMHWLAWRRIGGQTGDTLGAAGTVTETVALLSASATL